MNSSYRILKLQSGEEIIAKIKGKDRGKIILDIPMLFQTTSRTDMFGKTKEITFLKDWLSNTIENTIRIPETFIISWLKPSQNVIKLYDIERNIKQQDTFGNSSSPSTENTPASPLDMSNLLDALDSLSNNKDTLPDRENAFFMHMMIPPDVVKDLFEQGMLENLLDEDDSDIDHFYKEISENNYTGDQTEDPNFGNRWTDWNPDPNDDDYL